MWRILKKKKGEWTLKKTIHIFTMFLTTLLIVSCIFTSNKTLAAGLTDVPSKYASEINYLVSKGIVTGYPGGELRPNQLVTREEAAAMIGRALKLNGTKRQTPFSDVSSSSYASGYIASAYQKGIIKGKGDGLYHPSNHMTRLEMAYIIVRGFNLSKVSTVKYADMPANPEQAAVINKLTTAGITNGSSGNMFKPNDAITRAEFSLMLARALNDDFKVSSNNTTSVTKYVTASALNVRSGPGTSYSVMKQLTYGSAVKVTGQTGNWYSITIDGKTGYVSASYISDKQPAQQQPTQKQTQKIIAVDAGHGGSDPGASGNGLVEKDITLDVAKRLQKYLTNGGYKVVMTRSDDTYISLDGRVKYALDHGADIFISIHVNSYTGESGHGTETYYYNGGSNITESKKLASFMEERLLDAMDTTDRGVKTAAYRVLKANTLPATLVELAFITNSNDAKKLGSATYRDKAAKALYLGVQDYYKWLGK